MKTSIAFAASILWAVATSLPDATRLPTGAAPGSGMYSLAVDSHERAYLSWIEPDGAGHALKFATLDGRQWSAPTTVGRGDRWFVNWADHPSVVPMPDGSLAAHWLVVNDGGSGDYAYGLRIARSTDRGATWRQVFADGTDNLHDYSGFVSLLPAPDGFDAVYLTPPRPLSTDPAEHMMTLRHVSFDSAGKERSGSVVDGDTCSCCTTSFVRTSGGLIAAYRDHQLGEIRDISIVRRVGGRWTPPQTVHRDGWEINACPTNGPVLAATGAHVAIAWFTAAHDRPVVNVAFSDDAGEHFGAPTSIAGPSPAGWPAIALLDDGAAAVAWLERTGQGQGELRLRRIGRDGTPGATRVVARAPATRSTGIPQMVRVGDRLLLAWRSDRIESALVPLPAE